MTPHDIKFPAFLKSPLLAVLFLLLVASLRFNRNDWVISRSLGDAAFFIANVEKARGIESTTYPYKRPFNERILGTTLASFIPSSPLTAINLTNLAFLLAAIYFLFKVLRESGISENLSWLGIYLFIFSFPTFYYSTIGYIDPTVLACIFAGFWAALTGKPYFFLAAIFVGSFAKENIIILVPLALAIAFTTRQKKWVLYASLGLLLIISVNLITRNVLSETASIDWKPFWEPSSFRSLVNLQRPNFYISTVLSWGIPLFVCCYYFLTHTRQIFSSFKDDLPIFAGIATIAGATFYMITSAFPDGRNVWVSSCFPILLMLRWWQRYGAPFGLHFLSGTSFPKGESASVTKADSSIK